MSKLRALCHRNRFVVASEYNDISPDFAFGICFIENLVECLEGSFSVLYNVQHQGLEIYHLQISNFRLK